MGRPGLLGTAARTAVIAGTATAVSGNVQRRQMQRAADSQQAAAAQQQALVDQAAAQAAAQMQATAPPPAAAPAPAAPAPAEAGPDRIQQLKDLAGLREAGVLTDAEFEAEKTRILGS